MDRTKRQRDDSPTSSRKKPVSFLGHALNKLDIDELAPQTPAGNTAEDYRAALSLAVPNSKKSLKVWNQIAVDEKGRRRFHGAFTGGFSAGYFNTVDTPEGWKPSQFQSSRAERHKRQEQKAEDFMDEEDYENIMSGSVSTSSIKWHHDGSTKDNESSVVKMDPDEFEIFLSSSTTADSADENRRKGGIGSIILKRMGWRESGPIFNAPLRRPPKSIGKAIVGPQLPERLGSDEGPTKKESLYEKEEQDEGM